MQTHSVARVLLCLAGVAALQACSLAPGPHLDATRMNDDLSKKVSDQVYPVTLITPQLIAGQVRAQMQRPAPFADASLAAPAATGDYRVGAGDVIGVTIWGHPELASGAAPAAGALPDPDNALAGTATGAQEVDPAGQRVSSEGTIVFPTLGQIQVAGKTTTEIRALIVSGLSRNIIRPQLQVHVLQYRSQKIQITGDLKTPGTLPITDGNLKVIDAIARAGGTLPDADLQRVQLTRDGKTTALDIQAALSRGEVDQNVVLRNGDVLNVPDHSTSRVFVMGEIMKPQSLFMNNGRLTLADAISNASGPDSGSADPRQVLVIRHSDAQPTQPAIYRLDMTQVDALMLSTQFQLHPLDVVYVGTAPLARFNRVLSQLLPTAESLYFLNSIRP